MKRATTISLVGLGTGLVALYSFAGERKCTEPDPTSPLYQQQVNDYARCRSRRSSSSSSSRSGSSWNSGTSTTSRPTSTASRGGFGSSGVSSGG